MPPPLRNAVSTAYAFPAPPQDKLLRPCAPFGTLDQEIMAAAGHGDEFALVALRHRSVAQRHGLPERHGWIGVAMKYQRGRHQGVELMQREERPGLIAETDGLMAGPGRHVRHGTVKHRRRRLGAWRFLWVRADG